MVDLLVSEDVEVDVLHVNHHRGNNASSAEFVERIDSEIAVISLGNDSHHGHPHRDALERLVDAGIYRIIQTSWGMTSGSMPDESSGSRLARTKIMSDQEISAKLRANLKPTGGILPHYGGWICSASLRIAKSDHDPAP